MNSRPDIQVMQIIAQQKDVALEEKQNQIIKLSQSMKVKDSKLAKVAEMV